MNKFGALCLSLVAVLSISSAAVAQPPGGGGGRGGMFGMGGPGVRVFLLRNEKVQEELKLSEDQIDELEMIFEELPQRGGGRGGDGGAGGAGGGRGGEGGAGGAGGGRGGFDPEVLGKIEEKAVSILDKTQNERLTGIVLWNAGAQAVLDPHIAEAIELTEEQQEEIEAAVQSHREAMREEMMALRESGGGREEMAELFQSMNEDIQSEIDSILTDDQKKTLEELKGEEFKIEMGGGRGGRGGGGDR